MSNNPKDAGDGGAIAAIVFLIAIAAVPLIWAGMRNSICPAPPNNDSIWSLNCFEFWLNRYQTLLGGVLAIVAALLAYWGIHQQMKQAHQIAIDDRIAAEKLASRDYQEAFERFTNRVELIEADLEKNFKISEFDMSTFQDKVDIPECILAARFLTHQENLFNFLVVKTEMENIVPKLRPNIQDFAKSYTFMLGKLIETLIELGSSELDREEKQKRTLQSLKIWGDALVKLPGLNLTSKHGAAVKRPID